MKEICREKSPPTKASEIENSIVLSYIGKLDFKNYPVPKWKKNEQAHLYFSQLALSLLQKSEVRLRLGNKNK